ncbi:MAG: hypothetical protein ABEJ31_00640 [Haloarculaceae archaeon]
MSDSSKSIEEFVERAETVYEEYDQGYMNPDVALERIRAALEDLEADRN